MEEKNTNKSYKFEPRYFDKYFQKIAVKLLPGQFYVTKKLESEIIVTVLGSCVAVCLRDVKNQVAGMNHFMLPGLSQDLPKALSIESLTRYGESAMEILLQTMYHRGAKRENIVAKVFGGGAVLAGMDEALRVGQKNAEFALQYLQQHKIPIISQDILQIYPRKIYFFPDSGKVLVKKLHRLKNNTIYEREKVYSKHLLADSKDNNN